MVKLAKTINREMFYGASPIIFERAKWLRENQTDAEMLLWNYLKNKQILNLRFKPQHPIKTFIADFYCHKIKLVIEVDGESHLCKKSMEYDQDRSFELSEIGITVIRFTNFQVFNNIEEVISVIKKTSSELINNYFLHSP